MNNKHKYPNVLAQARRRLGLSRKRVASLLRLYPGTIEKYERGKQVPHLRIALQLEILYRTPVAFLYVEIYKQMRTAIRQREGSSDIRDTRPFIPGNGGAG